VKNEVKKWLKEDGNKFLREMGMKRGQTILDFGCGRGHYAIPAAQVVGDGGKVYAVEKESEVLDTLMERAATEGLKNIERVDTSGELRLPLEDRSCDVALLYDILHYSEERKELIDEVYRVLKPGALLSVYPKHHRSDNPSGTLAHMSLEDVIEEIESLNFQLERKYFGNLLHDDSYNEGYVLNFRRR
jgi:ubiquinone/menaquinone biosynthesis C-methylase UbiE